MIRHYVIHSQLKIRHYAPNDTNLMISGSQQLFRIYTVDSGYNYLKEAAYQLNHTRSQEELGFEYLYGKHLGTNLTGAEDMFSRLAENGFPRGQTVSVFLNVAFSFAIWQALSLLYCREDTILESMD